jgi:hypothetical protein
MDQEHYLVPGRECGACTACCKELAILEPSLKKLPGVLCRHCTDGKGCSIYAERPQVCRSYYCLWRRLPNMDASWRPDLSGILIVPLPTPPGYSGPFAVEIMIVGGADALRRDRAVGMIAGFVASGTATFLNAPGEIGMYGRNSLLNDALAPAVAARNLDAVKALIWSCYEAMIALPQKPIPAEQMG